MFTYMYLWPVPYFDYVNSYLSMDYCCSVNRTIICSTFFSLYNQDVRY